MNVRIGLIAVVFAGVVAAADEAHAGGVEYPAVGTRALGRGGAFHARADDPNVMLYNPAGLAELRGSQFLFNTHVGFFNACAQRTGTYTDHITTTDLSRFGSSDLDPGAGGFALESYAEVCNEGPPAIGPGLAYTTRLSDDLGLGFGILAPAAAGHTVWGAEDGIVRGVNGEDRPSPLRYNLVEEQLIILFPSVGVGYRVAPWLRVGATLGWGVGFFDFINVTVATKGEGPMNDIWTELSASDLFIPQAHLSAHLVPHDNLDVVVGFKWTDDVSGSGSLDLEYGRFGTGMPGSTMATSTLIEDVGLEAPQPWQFSLGVRYADRTRPRDDDGEDGEIVDAMSSERWDIELDVVYELNSRVDNFVVNVPTDAVINTREVDAGGNTLENQLPVPDSIPLPHHWKDQLSIRLGGDYNVIPGELAIRAGVSYETRGMDLSFMQVDFMPLERYGAHVGATYRTGSLDLSAGFAFIQQESVTTNAEGSPKDGAEFPQVSADEMGFIVNAGTYESSFTIFSVGMNYHFD